MSDLNRREVIKVIAVVGIGVGGTTATWSSKDGDIVSERNVMASEAILDIGDLGFPWKTQDPFIFCVYHEDYYPKGNDEMGPASSLAGRPLGSDFELKDGFRMYHGRTVPGFPQHPHRGFETVTVVRQGLVDHSDSLGAKARYGNGDVQWLTTGKGILHAEMFPLLNKSEENPMELFQLWLNLPSQDKMVEPHFRMLWNKSIPRHIHTDEAGKKTSMTIVAGQYADKRAPDPAPHSWAARADSDVAIWTLKMQAGARWILPAADGASNRNLYIYRGSGLRIGGQEVLNGRRVQLRADASVELVNLGEESELLLLQGRPIGEPVVQHGPFVMNTADEIRETFEDYRKTQFGGWNWDRNDPVHGREQKRFAHHADGKKEVPSG